MSNMKIFRTNHGEGKTKWLVDKAIEAYANGATLIYVGCEQSQERFEEAWMYVAKTVCPIKNIEFCTPRSNRKHYCMLTDDLLENLWSVYRWYNFIDGNGYEWYVTIDKEHFVN